ncbi:MAG: hypothetical protein PF637_05860 [Spirochaetes bacterium]|jgi:hypothetical protein|nr:hypothetical protein [Spirochaetota bacterium]
MIRKRILLQEIKNGIVVEEMNTAINTIAENLSDDKTDQFKPRSIILKLNFQRSQNAEDLIGVSYSVEKKLVSRTEDLGIFALDCTNEYGEPMIVEQLSLFDSEV